MNQGSSNSTPHSSSILEKQPNLNRGSQGSKQTSTTSNDKNEQKESLISKNASLISDIVHQQRGKVSEFNSPDKSKKIIQVNMQGQPRSHHLSQPGSLRKLHSPTKTQESQTSTSNIRHNFNIIQNNSAVTDPRLPQIFENNIKITEQIQQKKLQNSGYLFRDEEELPNQQSGNHASSILSQKMSSPSISQFTHTPNNQKQQKQNSPIVNMQQKLSQSQSLNQTGNLMNSPNNSQFYLGQGVQQSTVDSFYNIGGQINSQQASKIFTQTQNNLYQLDKLMRSQMRDNFSSLDSAQLKTPVSSSQRNIIKNIPKFMKGDNNSQNSTKINPLQSTISARDISYIQEQRQSIAKQTETRINFKTEQNMNILLSPKQSLSDSKQILFNSRKSSFNDLKHSVNNQLSKSPINGFQANFLNTPTSTQKQIKLPVFRSSNDLASQSGENQYNLMPHLPNNFVEEFLQIVKETNISGDSSQLPSSNNLLTPISFSKTNTNASSNTQVLKSIHSEIQSILANQTITPMQHHIPSSLAELATSLKRSHPNLYTGQPSGRAEVQVVKHWLEGIFEFIQIDREMHIKEKFQKVDDSLILTFNELVRQVSYQCKERGMLLITVFSCYFSLVKKVSQYEQEEKRKINIQNQYEKLLLQKNADDDLENKNSQIKALQELLQLEQDKNAQFKEELKLQEEREKVTIVKNEKLKKLNDFAKVQLIKMKREMDDLRSRLQSKEMFQQKKLEKFLLDYKSNLKRQASTQYYSGRISEKLEEQDQQLIQNLLDIPKPKNLLKKGTIDDINDKLELSFTELIKEVDEDAKNFHNEVFIKQVFEDKSSALICQETQTDPMMTLTYTKSIKVQTDLDLIDKKYDKVFASKQKIDEFIREQQIKADLFSLEDQDENDTSIDQENGPPSSRNPDKPTLSNLFSGLPIKKLKKKLPKNQLERFIENMGVLYSYVREPETNIEKDKTENLKNMIQQNIRKEELQDLISMREIKEVDELQEGEVNQRGKKRNNSQKSEQQLYVSAVSSQTNIPSSQPQQGRNGEFKRNTSRQNTLSQLKKKTKMLEAMNLSEKNALREQIKQQFEVNFYQNLSNQQLIEQIKKQQTIIEQIAPCAFGEASMDTSFTNKKVNTSGSSPHNNKTIIQGKRGSICGTFQDQAALNHSPSQRIIISSIQGSPQGMKNQIANTSSINNSSIAPTNSGGSQKKIQLVPSLPTKGVAFKEKEESQVNIYQGQGNTSISYSKHDETNTSILSQDQNFITPDLQMIQGGEEVKLQVMSLMQLYNMEIEKNTNLRESLEELIKLLRELYAFLKLLFIHIKKTQKHTHKSIIEGFIQQFTSIKWKLPKEFDTNFDKEILREDKEDDKKKQLRLKFSNKKSTIKFLAHVQKTQAFTKMTIVDKNTHFGFLLINKIREQGIPKKFTSFLPLKNTLKYIQNLVDERVRMIREQRLPKDQEMPIFTFNKFLQIFGFKKVAENKFTQFLMSVLQYQSIFRVNMFARLLTVNLEKKVNYSIDEMEKYFQAYEFIVNLSTMGVLNPQHSETDSTFMVPLLKALDYVKVILEKIMPFEDIIDLRQQLENMKEIDLKSTNKIPVVDFDLFMSKVLTKYRILMNKTQLFVKNAFFAADLDGNGRINLNEFLTLYRHIMANRFNLMKCIKMFEEKADIITEEEKNLSFEKFTAICIDYNLFTTQIQDKYINVSNKEDILQRVNDLNTNWNEESTKIKEKIDILKPFVVPESYKNWVEILKVLEHRILDEQIQEENQRPILIAHKLLNDELQRLIDEGKKGGENDEDDDDDDEDLFNFQDEDDTDLQMILKSMTSKNNQNNGMNITIQESQSKQLLEEELSRNDTQLSTSRIPTQPK